MMRGSLSSFELMYNHLHVSFRISVKIECQKRKSCIFASLAIEIALHYCMFVQREGSEINL